MWPGNIMQFTPGSLDPPPPLTMHCARRSCSNVDVTLPQFVSSYVGHDSLVFTPRGAALLRTTGNNSPTPNDANAAEEKFESVVRFLQSEVHLAQEAYKIVKAENALLRATLNNSKPVNDIQSPSCPLATPRRALGDPLLQPLSPVQLTKTDKALVLQSAGGVTDPPCPGSPFTHGRRRSAPCSSVQKAAGIIAYPPPPLPLPTEESIRQEQAASLIAAAVKSWLVRRELKEMNENRKNIVFELYTTEQSYISALKALQVFRLHFQEAVNTGKPIISPHNIFDIFHKSAIILQQSERLVKNLEPRISSWRPAQIIGDILLEHITHVDFSRIHKEYIVNYRLAIKTLHKCSEKNKRFKEVLSVLEGKLCGTTGNDITSFLIQPVQRLPRYFLLLKKLSHVTHPMHPDQRFLCPCVAHTHQICEEINMEQDYQEREEQKREDLKNLSKQLVPKINNLLAPERFIIREGEISIIDVGGQTQRNTTYYLLTDMLLFTEKTKKGTMFLCAKANLAGARLRDIPDGQEVMGMTLNNALEVHSGEASLLLRASSQTGKNDMITALSQAIQNLNKKPSTQHQLP
ncbi:rho guanine nucleotide exchange factor 17 [Pelomyxa schiedti]|nr:rho guanine nucleotide exchange factor 17 [Pelomyxa schiedti]